MAGNQHDRPSYQFGRDPSVNRCFRPRPERQINLFEQISEDPGSDSSASSIRSDPPKVCAASVYLRLRPTSGLCPNYCVDKTIFKTRGDPSGPGAVAQQKDVPEKHFTFSNIFDGETPQFEIYNQCIHSAIESEENLTVLTYGTSGSGKTYTLMGGGGQSAPGIIPRAIEHVFAKYSKNICDNPGIKVDKGNVVILEDDAIQNEKRLRRSLLANCGPLPEQYEETVSKIHKEHDFQSIAENDLVFIWISFAEIYNEVIYDLLSASTDKPLSYQTNNSNKENSVSTLGKRKALTVISNDGNAFIKDLTTVSVRSSAEAYRLLTSGQTRVNYASTNINTNSSRSHCIFIIDVIRFNHSLNSEFLHTTYKLCDLAGSERLKKTDNIGSRLNEAKSINTSLLVLGRCLDAVYQKSTIVPFRESKLTTLLQAPLCGKEKITMVVNMLPTATFYEENIHVLNFASKARQIVYKPPPNARAARSTRYSWFISKAASNSPVASPNNSQISILLEENDRYVLFKDYYYLHIQFVLYILGWHSNTMN